MLPDDSTTDEGLVVPEGSGEETRCGYAAIVGAPNSGKSTLMNAIVGERLSIVTSKPHTTRGRVLGIITDPNLAAQVIFLDTPGLIAEPRYRLQEVMVNEVRRSLVDSDVVLVLFDYAQDRLETREQLAELARESGKPLVHVLNKIDLASGEPDLSDYPEGTIPISALMGANLAPLGQAIAKSLPAGPYLYPPDALADQPERFFAAEFVRETVFDETREEIPYTTAVRVDEFIERQPKDYISATILVDRDSQKGIIIGKGGGQLKRIGQISRRKIEEFIGRSVYLELHVRVKRDWMKQDSALRDLGYLEG